MRRAVLTCSTVLSLAACGDDTASPASTSPPPTTATSTPPTTAPTAAPTTSTTSTSMPVAPGELFRFDDPVSVDGWYVQNDTVMGGVSESGVEWRDGTLVFAGSVSLDNNGGFASIRSPRVDDWAGHSAATALYVSAIGDGKTYVVQVRSDRASFSQRFVATPGEAVHELPLSAFVATNFMLEPVVSDEVLTGTDIRGVSLYIFDKQEGPFELRLRSITLG